MGAALGSLGALRAAHIERKAINKSGPLFGIKGLWALPSFTDPNAALERIR